MPETENTRRPVSPKPISDVENVVVDESVGPPDVEAVGTQRRPHVVVVALEDSNPGHVVTGSKVACNAGHPKQVSLTVSRFIASIDTTLKNNRSIPFFD